jgi:hypothetical protein
MEITKEILETLDETIRAGRVREARAQLKELARSPAKQLHRNLRLPLAALARRTGLFSLALQLLHSAVRSEKGALAQSSPAERVEYAGSLLQLGAVREARELLATVPGRDFPLADLFLAFGHFSEWEYGQAAPVLRRYVANPLLTGYQRLIGEVNLAAAMVIAGGQPDETRLLIERLLARTEQENNQLLYGNVLEIAAQDAFYQNESARMLSLLERIPNPDDLMARKWRAIAKTRRHGQQERGCEELRKVRSQALRELNWEAVRECDLFLGAALGEESLLRRVYFGSPFPAYRARVEQMCGRRFSGAVPSIELGSGENSKELDLMQPTTTGLKPGQLPHRLLLALFEDAYKPKSIAALHGAVFPESYFNPLSSPQQVHQGLKRLRLALAGSASFLGVAEAREFYRLRTRKGVRLEVKFPKAEEAHRIREAHWALALRRDGFVSGKARQVATIWGISLRSANRALGELARAGKLEKRGKGKATVYRWR